MLSFLLYLPVLLFCVLVVFYAERKLAAFIQDRMGPTQAGRFGTLQAAADLLKLLQKEDIVPAGADRTFFLLAPLFIFCCVFAGFAVLPLGIAAPPSDTETGVFYLLAIISLDIAGLIMAGRSSNSKFALMGALRAASQVISYEVPVGLCVLCAALLSGSLNLTEINAQQATGVPNFLFGLRGLGINVGEVGGILSYNIVRMPLFGLVFLVYYIATLAECNRAPFDLPEGESELVGGFHTEYSGFRFALFFLSEYSIMILVSAMGAILFLGGSNTPFPNIGSLRLASYTGGGSTGTYATAASCFWLFTKTMLLCFSQIWVRWTFPRLRTDQLMNLCWKVLTPLSLLLLLATACWKLLM